MVTGLETPLIRLVTCRRAERAIAAGSHLCPLAHLTTVTSVVHGAGPASVTKQVFR
jgi:hypothetical protein